MTDWEAIKGILAEDCKLQGRYINDEGETCAVGALGIAAGFHSVAMKTRNTTNILVFRALSDVIWDKLGLSLTHLHLIQRVNDAEEDPERRRAKVLQVVDILEEHPEYLTTSEVQEALRLRTASI